MRRSALQYVRDWKMHCRHERSIVCVRSHSPYQPSSAFLTPRDTFCGDYDDVAYQAMLKHLFPLYYASYLEAISKHLEHPIAAFAMAPFEVHEVALWLCKRVESC